MEGICLNKPAFRFGDYNLDFLNGIYKFDEKTFLTNLLKKDFNNISENSHLYQAIYEHSFEIDYDKYCYGYEEKNESDFIKKFIQPLVNNFLALKIF